MIKDVRFNEQKNDLEFMASELPRAENLIGVQLGSLVFQPDWGVDLQHFLNPNYEIQAECFESHLIQRIGFWGMNVIDFIPKQGKFIREMIFNFTNTKDSNSMMRG